MPVVNFSPPLLEGWLIKRYKRFFVDVELLSGEIVVAHCPNTGSMLGVIEQGRCVGLSFHSDPKRKLSYTLEMIADDGVMVGVNTLNPNKLVSASLQRHFFPMFEGYSGIHKEVKINTFSRIDFALTSLEKPTCYIEVKNVHYKKGDRAYFPDSVTKRGQKHIKELIYLKEQGYRCAMLYIIQREDVNAFSFADFIDSQYTKLAQEAAQKEVEMYAFTTSVNFDRIELQHAISIKF